jgi:hypothetical protein
MRVVGSVAAPATCNTDIGGYGSRLKAGTTKTYFAATTSISTKNPGLASAATPTTDLAGKLG